MSASSTTGKLVNTSIINYMKLANIGSASSFNYMKRVNVSLINNMKLVNISLINKVKPAYVYQPHQLHEMVNIIIIIHIKLVNISIIYILHKTSKYNIRLINFMKRVNTVSASSTT
jgi:hypothetical protein